MQELDVFKKKHPEMFVAAAHKTPVGVLIEAFPSKDVIGHYYGPSYMVLNDSVLPVSGSDVAKLLARSELVYKADI